VSTVQARGIGKYPEMVCVKKLAADSLAEGAVEALTDQSMFAAEQAISAQVQSEDGVANAINLIDKMVTSFTYPWPIKDMYNKR